MTSKSISAAPKITIGIPTLNRRSYLMLALESALAQTYSNIEVIVSDNASTDDTLEYLAAITDPRLRVLRQSQNIGMVGNFNATLDAATGEFFLLLSDDDLLAPAAIERLSAPILQPPATLSSAAIGIVWCNCTIIDSKGISLWDTAAGPLVESSVSLIENLWLGFRGPRLASVLERTSDARLVGRYDESRFGVLCDTGNWGQVALRYPSVVCVPQPLVKYRVHPSSGTANSVCSQWQQWGISLHSALVDTVRSRGDENGATVLERLKKPLLANLTVDVLMRGRGTPGWIGCCLSEFWRSRTYLLTAYCARRILREGCKLLR